MLGVIERVKNNVLLKCSTLNEKVISEDLEKIIDTNIYHFAEDLISMLNGINIGINEDEIRIYISDSIKYKIIKKLKRKLFVDSLALQITNDTFIEKYVNKEIDIEEIKRDYLKELISNENSNQLNMTEDLNISSFFIDVRNYINKNVVSVVKENIYLAQSIESLYEEFKDDTQKNIIKLVDNINSKYLDIVIEELEKEVVFEEEKEMDFNELEGDNMVMDNNIMYEYNPISNYDFESEEEVKLGEIEQVDTSSNIVNNKFESYDDMTLFNKMILSLNTKEEQLARKEAKLKSRKEDIDSHLNETNKVIEKNVERENNLSQRKVSLSAREVELNSKLSEAEVIFLNIKPLIKGLNDIALDDKGGKENE